MTGQYERKGNPLTGQRTAKKKKENPKLWGNQQCLIKKKLNGRK